MPAKVLRGAGNPNFVRIAPLDQVTALLVFSGEKQTRRSKFGASGPRLTHLNTRHDVRQYPNLALPGRISRDSWIWVVAGTPTFSHFHPRLYIGAAPLQKPNKPGAREKNVPIGSGRLRRCIGAVRTRSDRFFSRAGLRGLLKRRGADVQRGEDFVGFLAKRENLGFGGTPLFHIVPPDLRVRRAQL